MTEDITERLKSVNAEAAPYANPLVLNWCYQAADEIERLRACDEQHYRAAKQTWQAIPDEFKLSPTDGGAIDEHFAIADMAKEIERLRAHVQALQQKIDADRSCACAHDAPDDVCLPHSPVVAELRTNLSEAIRLMEPAAESAEQYKNYACASVHNKDARAIADFVQRMRGK